MNGSATIDRGYMSPVRQVACPKCGVQPGYPCLNSMWRQKVKKWQFHKARKEAALKGAATSNASSDG